MMRQPGTKDWKRSDMFKWDPPPIEARYLNCDVPFRCQLCGRDATRPHTLKPVHHAHRGNLTQGWTCTGAPS